MCPVLQLGSIPYFILYLRSRSVGQAMRSFPQCFARQFCRAVVVWSMRMRTKSLSLSVSPAPICLAFQAGVAFSHSIPNSHALEPVSFKPSHAVSLSVYPLPIVLCHTFQNGVRHNSFNFVLELSIYTRLYLCICIATATASFLLPLPIPCTFHDLSDPPMTPTDLAYLPKGLNTLDPAPYVTLNS